MIKHDDSNYIYAYYWPNELGEADYNNPLTLKNVYEWPKTIFEPTENTEKQVTPIKSEFKQGHRKRIFNDEDI